MGNINDCNLHLYKRWGHYTGTSTLNLTIIKTTRVSDMYLKVVTQMREPKDDKGMFLTWDPPGGR